jgi:DHA2 family multidrug resistance protein
VQTLLAQRSQFHQARMVEQLNPLNPNYVNSVVQFSQALMGRGQSPAEARQQAAGLLYRQIYQQSQMLSYVEVFHVLMLVVFAAIPLLLFMQGKKPGEGPAPGGAA